MISAGELDEARALVDEALADARAGRRDTAAALTYAEVSVLRGHADADEPRRLARNAASHGYLGVIGIADLRDDAGMWPGCVTATNDKGAEILPGSVVVDALERARECLAEARWVAQHGRNLQVEAATMLDVDDVQRQRPVPSPGPVYGPPAPDVDSGEQSALDL